jgi:uncharacterized protein DUF2752
MTTPASKPEHRLDARAARGRMLLALLATLVLAASFLYAPYVHDGPVLCVSRLVAGVPCPACGLTRSFCAMASGHPSAAFGFHVFGPFLFALTVLAIPVFAFEGWQRRSLTPVRRLLFSRRLAWIEAALLVSYHLGRLASGVWSGELLASVKSSALGAALRALALS